MSEHVHRAASDPLQTIALLSDLFPQCFFVYGRRRRPLKVGIDRDIADALGSDDGIKAALRLYVSNFEYRRKLRVGAPRIDLDGNIAGEVSAAEAQFTEKILAKAARRRQLAIEAEAKSKEPPPPKRISLADLRASASARKAATSHPSTTIPEIPLNAGSTAGSFPAFTMKDLSNGR